MNNLGVITFIAVLIAIIGAFLFKGDLLINQINEEEARKLIVENFGKCNQNDCEKLEISIGVNKNKNMVIGEYLGLKDDSIKSKKESLIIEKKDGKWNFVEKLQTQFICHEGRGQQEYKTDYCN